MSTSLLVSPPSARPRVHSHGLIEASYGPEGVELCRSAGLYPDGWQVDQATEMLAYVPAGGDWVHPEVAEIVARQNGKGVIGEIRCLTGLFLLDERMIAWTAHQHRTAVMAFRRVLGWIEGTRDLARWVVDTKQNNQEVSITLRGLPGREITGRRQVRFSARSKDALRGFTVACLIIDEAYDYTDDDQAALMPTLSAGGANTQTLYLSSPPLSYDPELPLYRLRARGEAGAAGLLWRDWGAPAEVDPDDQGWWRRTNPATASSRSSGIRLSTIAREREAMSLEVFLRERLGVWPVAAGTGVIPIARWRACCDRDSRRDGVVAFAVDVNPERTASAIAVAGRRADGFGHIVVPEHRPGQGTDWVVPRLAEMVAKNPPCAVVVAPSGPAGSLIPEIEAAGIEVVKASTQDLAQACGALYDAVIAGQVRHIGQPVLDEAVAGARRRDLADAWAWARRTSAVDISPLVAVTLAAWGHATKGHQVADPLQNFW